MLAEVRGSSFDVAEVIAAVTDTACGGEAVFVGRVRDHDADRPVTRLVYEAHPSAPAELTRLCELAAQRPGVRHAAAVHRSGTLEVGDVAVVVAVSGPHRSEALEACHWLIDAIKHEVPIWKHQVFADGTDEWVGAC